MEEIEKVSLFAKKQEDLTVGDSLKVAGVVIVVCTVAPLVVAGTISGVMVLADKLKTRRLMKKNEIKEK